MTKDFSILRLNAQSVKLDSAKGRDRAELLAHQACCEHGAQGPRSPFPKVKFRFDKPHLQDDT